MKHLPIIFTISLSLAFCQITEAQTYSLEPIGIGLSGGITESSTGQLQHSIGEPMTDTWQLSASELRQGFQQIVEGFVTSVESEKFFNQLRTYPQPAREALTLAWDGTTPLIMRLSWWDISGRAIENTPVKAIYLLPGEKTVLPLGHLTPGTYLLLAEDENGTRLSAWPVVKLP